MGLHILQNRNHEEGHSARYKEGLAEWNDEKEISIEEKEIEYSSMEEVVAFLWKKKKDF